MRPGVLLLLLLAGVGPSQFPQSTFRTGVDVVALDVSVLDKNRQPVRGLTAAEAVACLCSRC